MTKSTQKAEKKNKKKRKRYENLRISLDMSIPDCEEFQKE